MNRLMPGCEQRARYCVDKGAVGSDNGLKQFQVRRASS